MMNRLLIGSLLLTSWGQIVPWGALAADEVKEPVAVKKTTKTKTPKPSDKPVVKPSAKPVLKAAPKKVPTQIAVDKNTIEEGGVRYELTSCKRVSETLVCRFLLTNNGVQDLAVALKVGGTRFIDITGEEYLAKEVNIGTSKSDGSAESILIPKVPIKATITFDEPAANVVTIKVLAINHEPGTALKFRDLKIVK
jgi:hypothetical protein